MLKILIIAVVIYLLVVTGSKIRLPHPGLQATVDVLKAANLTDRHVVQMASQYVQHLDSKQDVPAAGDAYTQRLARLTSRYESINGVPLNFKVYMSSTINAFATADGSVRVFSGLMDILTDEELMAIVGHEMGHIKHKDSINAMRKAYLTSAARGALTAVGGTVAGITGSQLGSIAEQYASAQFSQQQEFRADDFSFGFMIRNGYDPAAVGAALEKLYRVSKEEGGRANQIMQLFSTHPDIVKRTVRMKNKATLRRRKLAAHNQAG